MTLHEPYCAHIYNVPSFPPQLPNSETPFMDSVTVVVPVHTSSTTAAVAGLPGNMLLPDLVDQPPFLLKLRYIVDDAKYGHAIGWAEDGTAVVIRNEEALVKSVLPSFFKTRQLPSFIRQLHLYGFTKANGYAKPVNGRRPDLVFHNVNFIRNKPELMKLIKREPTKGKRPNIRAMPPASFPSTQDTGAAPNSPNSSEQSTEQEPHSKTSRLTIMIPESDIRQWTDYRSPRSDLISPRSDLFSPRSELISPRGEMLLRSPSGRGPGNVNWPLEFYEGGARLFHTRRKSTPYDRASERAAEPTTGHGHHHQHVNAHKSGAGACASCGCNSSSSGGRGSPKDSGSPDSPRRTSSLPPDGGDWRGLTRPRSNTEKQEYSPAANKGWHQDQAAYTHRPVQPPPPMQDGAQENNVLLALHSQSFGFTSASISPSDSHEFGYANHATPSGRRLSDGDQYSRLGLATEGVSASAGPQETAGVTWGQWHSRDGHHGNGERGHVDPLQVWYAEKRAPVTDAYGGVDNLTRHEQYFEGQDLDGVVWRPF